MLNFEAQQVSTSGNEKNHMLTLVGLQQAHASSYRNSESNEYLERLTTLRISVRLHEARRTRREDRL